MHEHEEYGDERATDDDIFNFRRRLLCGLQPLHASNSTTGPATNPVIVHTSVAAATAQKRIPSEYLYDTVGSRLFDAICGLREYGSHRLGRMIFERRRDEIARHIIGKNKDSDIDDDEDDELMIVELGSGNGQCSLPLFSAFDAHARKRTATTTSGSHPPRHRSLLYVPVDICADSIDCLAQTFCLASNSFTRDSFRSSEKFPSIKLSPFVGDYLKGLRHARDLVTARQDKKEKRTRMIVFFLGGTIGNFNPKDRNAFLCRIREMLSPGDQLFVTFDLPKPSLESLRLGYDDPAGVTAAFNMNLLSRANHELGTNFNLSEFRHRLVVVQDTVDVQHVEMHLQSRVRQIVTVPPPSPSEKDDEEYGAVATTNIEFDANETILTEESYKYGEDSIDTMANECGFKLVSSWKNDESSGSSWWPIGHFLFEVVTGSPPLLAAAANNTESAHYTRTVDCL